MAGCNINLSFTDEAETRRVYEALSEGGDIRQPLEPAFFAPLFSAFTDRFGTRWMVMTDSPQQA
jgi:PhnB protein